MVEAKPRHPTVSGDGMAFAALGKRAREPVLFHAGGPPQPPTLRDGVRP